MRVVLAASPRDVSAGASRARPASAAAEGRVDATPASVGRSVAVLAPRRSDAREIVAEALARLRDDLERMARRRFPTLDAGDVCQRAAVRALEHAEEVRDPGRVDAWIRRIVVTSALDLLRERNRREVPSPEPHDLEMPVADDDICGCALTLVRSLPESYADIIRRVDIDGDSLAEVAGALRIATGNAAVRLHRARSALRARLREHCGVESMRQCLSCICDERGCCGERGS